MIKYVKHFTAIAAVLVFSLATQAQKKDGDEQYFKNNFKASPTLYLQ